MTIHVYHPYRQPDGENFCQAVNGHCSHLCLPAPKIKERSPRISCACPTGLKLMEDGLMCVEDGEFIVNVRYCFSIPTWMWSNWMMENRKNGPLPSSFIDPHLSDFSSNFLLPQPHEKVFQLSFVFSCWSNFFVIGEGGRFHSATKGSNLLAAAFPGHFSVTFFAVLI